MILKRAATGSSLIPPRETDFGFSPPFRHGNHKSTLGTSQHNHLTSFVRRRSLDISTTPFQGTSDRRSSWTPLPPPELLVTSPSQASAISSSLPSPEQLGSLKPPKRVYEKIAKRSSALDSPPSRSIASSQPSTPPTNPTQGLSSIGENLDFLSKHLSTRWVKYSDPSVVVSCGLQAKVGMGAGTLMPESLVSDPEGFLFSTYPVSPYNRVSLLLQALTTIDSQEPPKLPGYRSVEEIVLVGAELANSIAALHSYDTFHGNITGDMLFVVKDEHEQPVIRLSECEFALPLSGFASNSHPSLWGWAPEKQDLNSIKCADLCAVDIWQLGRMLWKIHTNDTRFDKEMSASEITGILESLSNEPVQLSGSELSENQTDQEKLLELKREFRSFIIRMLNPNPAERPSIAEVETFFSDKIENVLSSIWLAPIDK